MKHGDFTELAENYARYRPGYSPFVSDAFVRMAAPGKVCVDAGAGTGIWSRQLASAPGGGGGGVSPGNCR